MCWYSLQFGIAKLCNGTQKICHPHFKFLIQGPMIKSSVSLEIQNKSNAGSKFLALSYTVCEADITITKASTLPKLIFVRSDTMKDSF